MKATTEAGLLDEIRLAQVVLITSMSRMLDAADDVKRKRFANDPANLLAVAGKANQDKGDLPPGEWMPPNTAFWCAYSMQFIEVLRGYQLPVDADSARELRSAAAGCPHS